MCKENQKRKGVKPDFTDEQIKKFDGFLEQQWEKDRSFDDELIIVKQGNGFLSDDELKELGMSREEYDALGEDDHEIDPHRKNIFRETRKSRKRRINKIVIFGFFGFR